MDKFDDYTIYNSDSEYDVWSEFTNYFYNRYLDDFETTDEKNLSTNYNGVIYFEN